MTQRLPQLIKANRYLIVEHWLDALKGEPEINSNAVANAEGRERMAQLLDIAAAVTEGKQFSAQDKHAYLRYGAVRYQQGYTSHLLMRESKLLQASVADYMQRHIAEIEMIYLVLDTLRLMGTIENLWKAAARGFVQQAHAEKVAHRRDTKPILGTKAMQVDTRHCTQRR
jgi:hypothetical protein